MHGRNRVRMLWAAAIVAGAVAVAVPVVLLARSGSEGTSPMVTPTPTATVTVTVTGDVTATATAGGTAWHTGTPASTATVGATDTPGSTATCGPTSTPGATAVPTGDGYHIYFTETDYQVSGEGQEFYTTINITPIELFYGGQFVLVWDCTLFEMGTGWTPKNGKGRLYNGTSPNPGWTDATVLALNPTGDNPQCPDSTQGRVNFVVDWGNYAGITRDGKGVNVSREGTLLTVRWRTHSGADFRDGTTDIQFAPVMKLGGYLLGAYGYTRPVEWTGTTVEVNQ